MEEKQQLSDDGMVQGSVSYQEICALPHYGKYRVQVSPWIVDGTFAGTVLRADEKDVLDLDSSVYSLRIIEEDTEKERQSNQLEKK